MCLIIGGRVFRQAGDMQGDLTRLRHHPRFRRARKWRGNRNLPRGSVSFPSSENFRVADVCWGS